MNNVHAIYENGMFRPVGCVNLPDPCEVEFEPHLIQPASTSNDLAGVYAVLAERYESGEHDVAARHDEHQP